MVTSNPISPTSGMFCMRRARRTWSANAKPRSTPTTRSGPGNMRAPLHGAMAADRGGHLTIGRIADIEEHCDALVRDGIAYTTWRCIPFPPNAKTGRSCVRGTLDKVDSRPSGPAIRPRRAPCGLGGHRPLPTHPSSNILGSGVDINSIRARLGHVSLATTNIHAEIDLKTKEEAMKATCPGDPGEQPLWKAKGGLLEQLKAI